VVLVDNVLWGGDVADPAVEDPATQQMRRFNDLVVADRRVESIIIPLGDGLTIARSVG
jgi:caffeoyl-CoA O-methyltransferase